MKKGNIDFICHRRMIWLFSLILVTVGIIANILMGTELDMRFTGGTVIRYAYNDNQNGYLSASDALPPQTETENTISESDISSASDAIFNVEFVPDYSYSIDSQNASELLSEALGVRVSVTVNDILNSSMYENKSLVVAFTENGSLGHNADAVIRLTLSKAYPNITLVLKESNSYDPIMGREFFYKCLFAIGLAVICMMLFVTARFHGIGGASVGVCGLIAVAHDIAIVYFTFVILRYPINSNFIAAVLAIIGHSLNSTVVTFDRIRENRNLFGTRLNVTQRTNLSLNQTVSRTVNTNICVLIFLAASAAVSSIAGIDSIMSFSIPMIFGVLSSCYSSLFISTTLWVSWCEYKAKVRKHRKKA